MSIIRREGLFSAPDHRSFGFRQFTFQWRLRTSSGDHFANHKFHKLAISSKCSGITLSNCQMQPEDMFGVTRGKSSRINYKLDRSKNNPEDSGGVKATELRSQQSNRRGARNLGVRHAMLFVFVLCTYIYTALPSIPGGDSGELLAEACQWGIPHPPGYPLLNAVHNTMSHIVRSDAISSLWPKPLTVGEIGVTSKVAFSANLLAGVFGAGTAVMICLAVEEWTRGSRHAYNPGAAAGAALLFSFSPLAWEYNTGTEVFALNNLLVATALYLTARSVRRPSMNAARVGATVCGLALSNQHASVLTLMPLVFSVLLALDRASLLSWQAAVELSGLWLPLGLSPYVVLASSAGRPQQGSWGDLSTLWGFLRHVSRAEYGTFRLGVVAAGDNAEGTLDRVRQYLVDSSRQTMYLGPPLGLIGIGWALATAKKATVLLKRMGSFTVGLIAAWLSYVVIWHGVLSNISLRHPMNRAVHARFWIQPNLVLCLAAGGGLGVVMNAVAGHRGSGNSAFCRKGGRVVSAALSLLLPVVMVAGIFWLHWDSVDRGVWSGRSHGWTMHLYGQALLSNLPERAVLLSHTDLDLNPARYLRVCEGFRSDVIHISLQMMPYPWWATVQAKLHPGVIFPPILPGVSTRRDSAGNAALVTRFLAANIHRGRPIFLDMQAIDERQIGDGGSYHGFSLVPHGLAYRVLPRLTLEETESWHPEIERQLSSLKEWMEPVAGNEYLPGSWEYAAISVYWDAHYQAGLFFLSYAVGVWAKTPKDEQRPHLLPALRNASTLLRRTLETVDIRGTFSSSRSDLLKNTVLAEVRLYHALQVALAASVASSANESVSTKRVLSTSSPVWEDLYAEMTVVKARCLELIPRFLTEALDDKDAEAFGRVYIQLRERG